MAYAVSIVEPRTHSPWAFSNPAAANRDEDFSQDNQSPFLRRELLQGSSPAPPSASHETERKYRPRYHQQQGPWVYVGAVPWQSLLNCSRPKPLVKRSGMDQAIVAMDSGKRGITPARIARTKLHP